MRRRLLAVLFLLFSSGFAHAEAPPITDLGVPELGAAMQARYGHRTPKLWGEAIPGVVTRLENPDTIALTLALTFDACEGGTDMRIIELLRRHDVPATLFITNRWLRNNQKIAAELAADPLFTFACHGKRHKPASVDGRLAFGIRGTRSIPALVEEVEDNARAIADLTGKRPVWYRSGTAHYDDVAIEVVHGLGMKIAGYTVGADAGATLPAEKVDGLVRGAPNGAIILCHINRPESGTYKGLARAIPALLEKGVRFVSLEEPE